MATEFEINIQLNLDNISGKLSELENKINKATPEIKPNIDLENIKKAITSIKFDKLQGLEINPNNLAQIKKDIVDAVNQSKITKEQANQLFSALNGVKIKPEVDTSQANSQGVSFGKLLQSGILSGLALDVIRNTISGAFSGLKFSFDSFTKFEDGMAGITKTAGLTKQETKALGDEILKIAPTTRSSTDELQKLAQIGGQFGVPKQELAKFTDEINKINVALGDEFSGGAEEVGSKLSVLKGLFEETKNTGFAESMTKIGSAINELGAAGTATGPEVSEFTARIGQLGPSLAPTITETLGLGAAFQEMGLSAEISSGGLTGILLTAGQKSEEFAAQIGITTSAFEELLKKSPNEALLTLAKSFENIKDDPAKLAQTMQELGLGSQEQIKVMSLLAGKTDLVREKQELASKAFQAGTSIQNEYNAVNNTTAANIAKAGNTIGAIAIKIGQAFKTAFEENPVFQKLSQEFEKFTQELLKVNWQSIADSITTGLGTAITFVTENFTLLSSLFAGALSAGVILGIAAAFTALGGAMGILTTTIALLTSPFVLLTAGLTALYLAWQTNFLGIQQITQTVWNGIVTVISTAWNLITTGVSTAFSGIMSLFGTNTGQINNTWNTFTQTLSTVWNTVWTTIQTFLTTAWSTITSIFTSSVQTVQGIWQGFTQILGSVWSAIWETIKSVVSAIFLTIVALFTGNTEQLNTIWTSFGEKLKEIWNTAWENIKTVFTGAWEAIKTTFDTLITESGNLMKQASDAIGKAWDDGWNYVKSIDVGKIAQDVIDGFVNGIKAGVANVTKAMTDMVDSAVQAAKNTLGIKSPSRVFMEIGGFIDQGMSKGVDKDAKLVENSINKLADKSIEIGTTLATSSKFGEIGSAGFGSNPCADCEAKLAEEQKPKTTPPITPPTPTTPEQPEQPQEMTPPTDTATGTFGGEETDKTTEQLTEKKDAVQKIFNEDLPNAIKEGEGPIADAITTIDTKIVELSNLMNENLIKIFTEIGANIPKSMINGMRANQRQVFSDIASLQDAALMAIGAEIQGRKKGSPGWANNTPDPLAGQMELARGFKSMMQASNSQNNQTNNTQNRNLNIGQMFVGDNSLVNSLSQKLGSFSPVG